MERESLMRKVRALFALGDRQKNSSEAEAMAAISKAHELLRQHNLSMADVSDAEKPARWEFTTAPCMGSDRHRIHRYEVLLSAAIAALAGVNVLEQSAVHTTHRRLVFAGDAADVAVAVELFVSLRAQIRQGLRLRFAGSWSRRHASYAEGFADQICLRVGTLLQEERLTLRAETLALVLQDKDAWLRAESEAKFGALPAGELPKQGRFCRSEYLDGRADGAEAELRRQGRLAEVQASR